MKVYKLLSVGKLFSRKTKLHNKDKECIHHPPNFLKFHCNISVQLLPKTLSHNHHEFAFCPCSPFPQSFMAYVDPDPHLLSSPST